MRGISADREQALWRSGVATWDDLERIYQPQLSLITGRGGSSAALRELDLSREALARRELQYFAEKLPKREHYRLAYAFPEETIFLDIETTGLSRYYDYITLVGVSQGKSYYVHLRGCNPQPLIEAINSAKVVVTFNGSLFDLPFVRQEFAEVRIPLVHVDLRFLARRAGLSGGQKEIEERLSIKRPAQVSNVRGDSAPALWHRFRRGDEEALRRLMLYNYSDVLGMKGIFDVVAGRLVKRLRIPLLDLLHPKFAEERPPLDADADVARLRAQFGNQFAHVKSAATIHDLVGVRNSPPLTIVGIDLTGSERRATGWCRLEGNEVATRLISTDDELVEQTLAAKPDIVSIDSPLSLPDGFKLSPNGGVAGKGDIMRFCERVLKRRGVNAYPAMIPSMQRLTARGIRLAKIFRSYGVATIESYPGAAQDVMNIPRKRASLELLEAGLAEFGVVGDFLKAPVGHDELDAITSAIVGVFFWSGRFERLGPDVFGDEALIIPDLKVSPMEWRSRVVVGLSGALAAGKTTAAQALQSMGLHYGRYSMVVEKSVRRAGLEPNRKALQEEGDRLHKLKGQRWLGSELLKGLPVGASYVIDGLRFPEDHAYLAEMFGPAFVHIHISAPTVVRQRRYAERGGTAAEFEQAERHDVEAEVSSLERLAHFVVRNEGSTEDLITSIRSAVNRVNRRSCQPQ
ncbi:MAG TPA: ribonuclease H-like domain-containing protein [Casimicrobiaceae bacterium]